MKTVDIKGSSYVMVNERILHFRNNYEGEILTEMLSNENGVCIFKALVYVNDKLVATGHAYEKEGSTFINKTSYIENAETSAVGRALGMLGIGIETSIASAEEVGNAIKQQKDSKKQPSQENYPDTTEPDVPVFDLSYYTEIIDKLKTAEEVKNYANDNWTEIKKSLNKEDQDKFKSYCSQIIDVYNKEVA